MKIGGLFLGLILLAPGSLAQTAPTNEFTSGCTEREHIAILSPRNPAYPFAIDLAKTLAGRGVETQCLCGSKLGQFFQGQKGAAVFRTDKGAFDALFLPKGQVFKVEMIERAKNGQYLYSFRGTPPGPPGPPWSMSGAKRVWRIQHENILVFVWGDSTLAARLEQALNPH